METLNEYAYLSPQSTALKRYVFRRDPARIMHELPQNDVGEKQNHW